MTNVLDETWTRADYDRSLVMVRGEGACSIVLSFDTGYPEVDRSRAAFAELLPALAKDLLATEWCAWNDTVGDEGYYCCPECRGGRPAWGDPDDPNAICPCTRDTRKACPELFGHRPDCQRGALCDRVRTIVKASGR